MKPPIVNTEPTQSNGSLNVLRLFSIFKKPQPYKPIQKHKDLSDKEFSEKIEKELGEEFFTKTLKIPKEKYFLFIGYCKMYKLKSLYKQNKMLEIIKLFKEKSIEYLKISREN